MREKNYAYDDELVGDNIVKNLVVRLKVCMEKDKISMHQLSRDSGVSVATICRILNFQTYPKFSVLFQLFCAVGIELHIVGMSKEDGEEVL